MIHHFTIRTYTAMLLDLFNDLEVQYNLKDKTVKTKNVPINYSTREKAVILGKKTTEELLSGNLNVLPRASLVFSNMQKSNQRNTNKSLKTNVVKNEDSIQYSWNAVPWTFNFDIIIKCRGMNELTALIEQIGPRFNHTIEVDVADAHNLKEHTRVPIKLLSLDWEDDDYTEYSSNVITLTAQLAVEGYLYPPIKELQRVKEFKMFVNERQDDDTYVRRSIANWDVKDDGLEKTSDIHIENTEQYPPVINGLVCDSFTVGENTFTGLYIDEDSKIDEMSFEFNVLSGNEYINTFNQEKNILNIEIADDVTIGSMVELQFKVVDIYGNYDTIDKIFTI